MENKPTEDKPWKIEIHSETNTNGLTEDQVKDVLDVLNDEYHVEYQKNWNKKMQDEYGQYPVAKWQNQKGAEIEETFRNALKYNIVDDKVSVDISLEVVFTKNFTKGDVYQWVEGLDRLVKAHSMIQIEKLVNKEKIFDEELSKQERKFLLNLIKSQRCEVKKLN
jgi:hypothetical protein